MAAEDALGVDEVALAGLAVVGATVERHAHRRAALAVVGGVGARAAAEDVGAAAAVEAVVARAAVAGGWRGVAGEAVVAGAAGDVLDVGDARSVGRVVRHAAET